MKKEIRILTGLHSGARLQLAAGAWQVGRSETADVLISDWQHATVNLKIGEDGRVTWSAVGANEVETILEDMQPVQFGQIIVCIGDAGATWPDDSTLLLEKSLPETGIELADITKPAIPQAVVKRSPRWPLCGGGAAVAAACIATALFAEQPSHAELLPSGEIVLRQVQERLSNLQQKELKAVTQGEMIVVSGIVHSNADAIAVRQMLNFVAPSRSLTDFANASDVIANIQDSLKDPALKVSYTGNGNFVVAGVSRSMASVQKTVTQIEKDFGSSVKRIDVNVTQKKRDWPMADSNAVMVADSLQYVKSQDGSKHFPSARD